MAAQACPPALSIMQLPEPTACGDSYVLSSADRCDIPSTVLPGTYGVLQSMFAFYSFPDLKVFQTHAMWSQKWLQISKSTSYIRYTEICFII